jgi:hypothetical protein
MPAPQSIVHYLSERTAMKLAFDDFSFKRADGSTSNYELEK